MNQAPSLYTRKGFTLVELSIVLVILGLLVGGVLTGQSLIRAAELRSVATDYHRYVTAIYTFRDKYFAQPGDMPNATTYWGIAGGSGADTACYNTASTDSKTCNGDGDGLIQGQISGPNYTTFNERLRIWQHLANAGLIEGSYIGTDARNAGRSLTNVPGLNIPPGRLSGAQWRLGSQIAYYAGTTASFAGDYANYLIFMNGVTAPVGNDMVISAPEAYNIDMKLDDGTPANGRLIAYKGTSVNPCTSRAGQAVNAALDAAATYTLSSSGKNCMLYMLRL